ncbi:MAG: serine/threonine protein kinase [Eubacterium sp.]|nr:serine/threonine protein kinase [Eubacterium sp.]
MTDYCSNCMKPLKGAAKCPYCGFQGDVHSVLNHLQPGTMLADRYLIGKVIGQGGFGITYIGMDTRLDLRVAVKEYYPSGCANRYVGFSDDVTVNGQRQTEFFQKGKERFLDEAKALAEFHGHAGIVDVRDYFEANQTAYIVMEYLEGQNLNTRLKEAPVFPVIGPAVFSVSKILDLMHPIFDALETIHAAHIIHRDISPDNLMLLEDGTLKLLDFGAAREVDFNDPKSMSVVLKNGYAPPEQYRPKGELGPWTDVYALCATIYKCTTGITPVNSLERESRDELEWPSQKHVAITAKQEAALKKGMAVRREDRFQSVAELREAFFEPQADRQDGHIQGQSYENQASVIKNRNIQVKIHEKKMQWMLWILWLLPAVFLVSVAFLVLIGSRSRPADENRKTVGSTQSSIADDMENPRSFYDENTMYYITMQADERMSAKEFSEGAEIIKGRLDQLAGQEAYAMQVHDDKIEFAMPKTCFGDISVEKALKCYISRSIELFAFSSTSADMERFRISRGDIESVELLNGSIKGVNASQYGYDGETYPYLQIILSDQCAREHRSQIEEWGDSFVFAQDMGRHGQNFYYYTFPKGDGKTFFVINDDGERYNQMVAYNLSREPLSDPFSFVITVNDVAWENVNSIDTSGKNQCNADELKEDTVSVVYTAYSADEWTDGQWMDVKKILKERLDALDQPYAFGIQAQDAWEAAENSVNVVIRTGTEHMGEPVMYWLAAGSGDIRLRSGLDEYSIRGKTMIGELNSKTGNGQSFDISLAIGNYSLENKGSASELAKFTKYMLKKKQNVLTLFWDDMPFCSAEMEEPVTDGVVHFDQLCTAKAQDAAWMVNLLKTACKGAEYPRSLSFKRYQFDWYPDGKQGDEKQFAVFYPQEEELKSKIQKTAPDADISFSKYTVYVYLHLNADEMLAKQAASLTKKIYKEFSFEDCAYQYLRVYFIDEDYEEDEIEMATVLFTKKRTYEVNQYMAYEGKVNLAGYFQNGRLKRYEDAFRDRIQKDRFYAKMEADWHIGEEQPAR